MRDEAGQDSGRPPPLSAGLRLPSSLVPHPSSLSSVADMTGEGGGRPGLDDFIEAFEQAQARPDGADLADFLPPPGHPLHLEVLRELVRVDLEYGWTRGRPTPLEDYRRRFPALFQDPGAVRAIAF